MKSLFATLLACTAFTGAAGQAVFSIEENFDQGIPDTFKIIDVDKVAVNQDCYKNVTFVNAWITAYTDNAANQAALSLSHTSDAATGAQENWLISPQVRVLSSEVQLRWDAKSIHSHLRETYKVMISTTDDNPESFTEITTIENEDYDWNTHIIPLKEYSGKDIYVAFVNVSDNKFILAIDNLTIGILPEVKFAAESDLKVFYNNDDAAKGIVTITNKGKRVTLKEVQYSSTIEGEEQEISQIVLDKELAPGESIDVEVEINAPQNTVTPYSIHAVTQAGESYLLIEDNIARSYYARKYLVEKMTAMWCNNCPEGDVYMHPIKKRLKDEMIYISSHCTDQLAESYWTGLQKWILNMPGFIVNRDENYLEQSLTGADKYDVVKESIYEKTYAQVNTSAMRDETDKSKVNISTEVEFAYEFDNSDDRYRLGYAIFNKEFNQNRRAYNQSNSATLPSSREYYFLPSEIPGEMMTYENVPILEATAFSGEASSLPAQIKVGEIISHETQLTIPEDYVEDDDLFIVAFAMSTRTGLVYNAGQADIKDFSGVNSVIVGDDKAVIDIKVGNNICNICLADNSKPYSAEIITIDGRIVKSFTGSANGGTAQIDLSECGNGFVIIKVTQAGKTVSKKAVIR